MVNQSKHNMIIVWLVYTRNIVQKLVSYLIFIYFYANYNTILHKQIYNTEKSNIFETYKKSALVYTPRNMDFKKKLMLIQKKFIL